MKETFERRVESSSYSCNDNCPCKIQVEKTIDAARITLEPFDFKHEMKVRAHTLARYQKQRSIGTPCANEKKCERFDDIQPFKSTIIVLKSLNYGDRYNFQQPVFQKVFEETTQSPYEDSHRSGLSHARGAGSLNTNEEEFLSSRPLMFDTNSRSSLCCADVNQVTSQDHHQCTSNGYIPIKNRLHMNRHKKSTTTTEKLLSSQNHKNSKRTKTAPRSECYLPGTVSSLKDGNFQAGPLSRSFLTPPSKPLGNSDLISTLRVKPDTPRSSDAQHIPGKESTATIQTLNNSSKMSSLARRKSLENLPTVKKSYKKHIKYGKRNKVSRGSAQLSFRATPKVQSQRKKQTTLYDMMKAP